jgi:hypothetical protein
MDQFLAVSQKLIYPGSKADVKAAEAWISNFRKNVPEAFDICLQVITREDGPTSGFEILAAQTIAWTCRTRLLSDDEVGKVVQKLSSLSPPSRRSFLKVPVAVQLSLALSSSFCVNLLVSRSGTLNDESDLMTTICAFLPQHVQMEWVLSILEGIPESLRTYRDIVNVAYQTTECDVSIRLNRAFAVMVCDSAKLLVWLEGLVASLNNISRSVSLSPVAAASIEYEGLITFRDLEHFPGNIISGEVLSCCLSWVSLILSELEGLDNSMKPETFSCGKSGHHGNIESYSKVKTTNKDQSLRDQKKVHRLRAGNIAAEDPHYEDICRTLIEVAQKWIRSPIKEWVGEVVVSVVQGQRGLSNYDELCTFVSRASDVLLRIYKMEKICSGTLENAKVAISQCNIVLSTVLHCSSNWKEVLEDDPDISIEVIIADFTCQIAACHLGSLAVGPCFSTMVECDDYFVTWTQLLHTLGNLHEHLNALHPSSKRVRDISSQTIQFLVGSSKTFELVGKVNSQVSVGTSESKLSGMVQSYKQLRQKVVDSAIIASGYPKNFYVYFSDNFCRMNTSAAQAIRQSVASWSCQDKEDLAQERKELRRSLRDLGEESPHITIFIVEQLSEVLRSMKVLLEDETKYSELGYPCLLRAEVYMHATSALSKALVPMVEGGIVSVPMITQLMMDISSIMNIRVLALYGVVILADFWRILDSGTFSASFTTECRRIVLKAMLSTLNNVECTEIVSNGGNLGQTLKNGLFQLIPFRLKQDHIGVVSILQISLTSSFRFVLNRPLISSVVVSSLSKDQILPLMFPIISLITEDGLPDQMKKQIILYASSDVSASSQTTAFLEAYYQHSPDSFVSQCVPGTMSHLYCTLFHGRFLTNEVLSERSLNLLQKALTNAFFCPDLNLGLEMIDLAHSVRFYQLLSPVLFALLYQQAPSIPENEQIISAISITFGIDNVWPVSHPFDGLRCMDKTCSVGELTIALSHAVGEYLSRAMSTTSLAQYLSATLKAITSFEPQNPSEALDTFSIIWKCIEAAVPTVCAICSAMSATSPNDIELVAFELISACLISFPPWLETTACQAMIGQFASVFEVLSACVCNLLVMQREHCHLSFYIHFMKFLLSWRCLFATEPMAHGMIKLISEAQFPLCTSNEFDNEELIKFWHESLSLSTSAALISLEIHPNILQSVMNRGTHNSISCETGQISLVQAIITLLVIDCRLKHSSLTVMKCVSGSKINVCVDLVADILCLFNNQVIEESILHDLMFIALGLFLMADNSRDRVKTLIKQIFATVGGDRSLKCLGEVTESPHFLLLTKVSSKAKANFLNQVRLAESKLDPRTFRSAFKSFYRACSDAASL